jgi:hypothetical protein
VRTRAPTGFLPTTRMNASLTTTRPFGADDRRVLQELSLPDVVSQDHDGRRTRHFVHRLERPAEQRRHTGERKRRRRDLRHTQRFHAAFDFQSSHETPRTEPHAYATLLLATPLRDKVGGRQCARARAMRSLDSPIPTRPH